MAPGVSSARLLKEVHIGARALLDPKLIWFGYITCLSQWGGGGLFTCSNDFYLPSRAIFLVDPHAGLHSSKRTSNSSKHEISLYFSFFGYILTIFLDPDPSLGPKHLLYIHLLSNARSLTPFFRRTMFFSQKIF
jgi:hypothetical protein